MNIYSATDLYNVRKVNIHEGFVLGIHHHVKNKYLINTA